MSRNMKEDSEERAMSSRVCSFLCGANLSMTTMSLGRRKGEDDIVHISLEDTGVGWAFDGHCGGGSVKAHGSENGGAPMSMGTGKAQASAFGTAPAQTRHVRLGRRLVEEDKTRGGEAPVGDIGAALLLAWSVFFYMPVPCG